MERGVDMSLDARIVASRGSFALDIEMTIEPGTTAALLGPNGAGKSTTVDVLAGTSIASTAGGPSTRIVLAGHTLDDAKSGVFVAAEDRRVGIVFQQHLLFDHLSVIDNIGFGPRCRGMSRQESRRIGREWLARVGLEEFADDRPPKLSGGQAQRVAIARALAADPELLIFDEPLAALDVATRVEMRRLLRVHLDDFAGPRLLITHDPTDAFLLADVIHVIEDGRITQVGRPDEIRRHPATAYVAALAETNLFTGHAADGMVTLDDADHRLTITDRSLHGAVSVTIHPRTISLHASRPEGSQRNTWTSTVELVEPLGDVVRITLGQPLPIAADVTPGSAESLELTSGSTVWAAVKATEVDTTPA